MTSTSEHFESPSGDPAARAAIREALLVGLAQLDPREDGWDEALHRLGEQLTATQLSEVATLREVVQASAELQQFLLEIALRAHAVELGRADIIAAAAKLLSAGTVGAPVQDSTPIEPLSAADSDDRERQLHEEPTTVLRGLSALTSDAGTHIDARHTGPDRVELVATSASQRPGLTVEVDLDTATGYWSPAAGHRLLPPVWEAPTVTSLVSSVPVGVLYDAAGQTVLGWAASEAVAELDVRCGVSEENKTFVVDVRPATDLEGPLTVVLDTTHAPMDVIVPRLAGWVSSHCSGQPRPTPAAARRPVYSTWYTFAQDVDAATVGQEASVAAALGCGSVFIDDGWQRFGHGRGYQGCGDWLPDNTKFPDLARTVSQVREQGSAVALWIAPLLLGTGSAAFAGLADLAPKRVPELNCHILDPRHATVRDHLAATCLRLVDYYGVGLLKIDFLEQAMIYRGSPSTGDLDDVGEAMQQLLQQIRHRLDDAGHHHVAFEFRQPYVSPAIARYGEILRANDCPADSITNRRSVVDARLLSVGQTIHSDPLMWGLHAGAEAVAQQLYAGWFSVPQISMRLTDLPTEQIDALKGLLQLWQQHCDVILDGVLSTQSPENNHLLVRTVHTATNRSVIAVYAPLVVDLDHHDPGTAETLIVNATNATRLLVRTGSPVTGGIIRSASGQPVSDLEPGRPGLIDVAVPAFGSVTVTR